MPTTPQNAAGCRTEPPVSEPSATGTISRATAEAEPPDDPPATRVRSCGLCVTPNAEFSVDEPIANSSRFVLPTMIAPAARSRRTTVASKGDRYPARMREPHVVGMSAVQMLSFNATGTPARGSRPRWTGLAVDDSRHTRAHHVRRTHLAGVYRRRNRRHATPPRRGHEPPAM